MKDLYYIKYHYRCKRCNKETESGQLKQTNCSTEAGDAIKLQLQGNMPIHECKDGGYGIMELLGVTPTDQKWKGPEL